jgi:hypothetical protein
MTFLMIVSKWVSDVMKAILQTAREPSTILAIELDLIIVDRTVSIRSKQ